MALSGHLGMSQSGHQPAMASDNEDQIWAISAKSFPVGSSKLAQNGRQK
jgi:hypothetical protein